MGNIFMNSIIRIFIQLFSVFFLTYFTTCYAATPSADVTNLLNSIKTMQSTFTQTIYDNLNKPIQKSYGKMAMQRPGKFRWDVTKPIPQLVVANDTRLWIYDRDLDQVTIRSLKKTAGETPALLLSHVDATIDKDFSVKQIPATTAGEQWYQLTPKNPDSAFAEIQMRFAHGAITEMHMQDHIGHTTVIKFQNIKTNINVSSSLFDFKPPANADVIDDTKKRK